MPKNKSNIFYKDNILDDRPSVKHLNCFLSSLIIRLSGFLGLCPGQKSIPVSTFIDAINTVLMRAVIQLIKCLWRGKLFAAEGESAGVSYLCIQPSCGRCRNCKSVRTLSASRRRLSYHVNRLNRICVTEDMRNGQ